MVGYSPAGAGVINLFAALGRCGCSRCMGAMIWLLIGPAVCLPAFYWSGVGGSRRFWAAGFSALAILTLGVALAGPSTDGIWGTSVIFLGLFISVTAILGMGGLFRRLPPAVFACFALSDAVLGLAFWSYQVHAFSWQPPSRGAWGPAAWLVVVAACLRLAGPALASDGDGVSRGGRGPQAPVDGALVSIGWWQGAILAFWVAPSAPLLLAVAGAVIWVVSAFRTRSRLSMISIAGGLVAIGAGLGIGAPAVMAIGLAGVALALGESVVAIWVTTILPLSVAARLDVIHIARSVRLPGVIQHWISGLTTPPLGPVPPVVLSGIWVAIFVSSWAAASGRLARTTPPSVSPSSGAWLASGVASGVSLASLGSTETLVWLAYAAALAALVSFKLANRRPGGLSVPWPWQAAIVPTSGPPAPFPRWWGLGPGAMTVGWAALAAGLGLVARLTLIGLRTGFL